MPQFAAVCHGCEHVFCRPRARPSLHRRRTPGGHSARGSVRKMVYINGPTLKCLFSLHNPKKQFQQRLSTRSTQCPPYTLNDTRGPMGTQFSISHNLYWEPTLTTPVIFSCDQHLPCPLLSRNEPTVSETLSGNQHLELPQPFWGTNTYDSHSIWWEPTTA